MTTATAAEKRKLHRKAARNGRSSRKSVDGRLIVYVQNEGERVRIAPSVVDLASFRDWADSDAFPEHGRIDFLDGEIRVDLTLERLFTHNRVTRRGYVAARSSDGWINSKFFNRKFRLQSEAGRLGHPKYGLHVRKR